MQLDGEREIMIGAEMFDAGVQYERKRILKEFVKRFYMKQEDLHPPFRVYYTPCCTLDWVEEFKNKLEVEGKTPKKNTTPKNQLD